MHKSNVSTIILLGFQYMDNFKVLLCTLLVVIYCLTLGGNFFIITLVFYSKNLQTPMYFFLTQLSISDIMLTTDIVPNMIHVVLNDGATISFTDCITQFYLFGSSEASECFLLTVMSYDRYLAICKPLHYTYVMNNMLCLKLIIISWLLSFSLSVIITFAVCQLEFCGPNVIDHFFCDLHPIVELSCSDISIVQLVSTFLSIPLIICPISLVIVSYIYIVLIILKVSTRTGRWRSFSTCSSHLTVVSIFYGTLIATYVTPNKGRLLITSKILSMLYSVFTPLFNPFIYSLRNKDIKEALLKVMYNYSGYYLMKSKMQIR
ncbi:olfactory receptor 11L1-like [Mixophyes fleayi]|uniref:olfactory receptor 11L1-like n=1 Tax=Mixophyes fleayi TaxID=3061075 RepID=UPI003F4DA3CC